MKNMIAASFIIIFLTAGVVFAADKTVLPDRKGSVSYSVGYQIGEDLKRQRLDFDAGAFLKGARDALADARPQFSAEEMRVALAELKKQILAGNKAEQEARRAELRKTKEKQIAEDKDFLAGSAKKEGVISLPGGLQYQVIREGKGKNPAPSDAVQIHYRATLTDGTEFDSSYREGKPKTYRVSSMIPGLRQTLPLMKESARWRIIVPADLAYSEGPFASRVAVFDLELISVGSVK